MRQLPKDQHLLTAEHTLKYWPQALYLPDATIDRYTREDWLKHRQVSLAERAHKEVERRLAEYVPLETDPNIDAELRKLVESGMQSAVALPEVPVHRGQSA